MSETMMAVQSSIRPQRRKNEERMKSSSEMTTATNLATEFSLRKKNARQSFATDRAYYKHTREGFSHPPVTSQGPEESGAGTRIAAPTSSSAGTNNSAYFRRTDSSAYTCNKLTCFARLPSLVLQPLFKLHSMSSSSIITLSVCNLCDSGAGHFQKS